MSTTTLRSMASKGLVREVRSLLASGAVVDEVDEDGHTALWVACWRGHTEVAKLLLAAAAQVDKAKSDGATPLFISCQEGHSECASLLLAHGAKSDVADREGATPLFIACETNRVDCAKVLLSSGAVVDPAKKDGATPLFVSCQNGAIECVSLLLAASADANRTMQDGASPLLISCFNGYADCVAVLLSARADATASWQGTTPLMAAHEENAHKCIALLEGSPPPLRFQATKGPTALARNLLPPPGASPLAFDFALYNGALNRAATLGADSAEIAALRDVVEASASAAAVARLAEDGEECPFTFIRARALLEAFSGGLRELPPHQVRVLTLAKELQRSPAWVANVPPGRACMHAHMRACGLGQIPPCCANALLSPHAARCPPCAGATRAAPRLARAVHDELRPLVQRPLRRLLPRRLASLAN